MCCNSKRPGLLLSWLQLLPTSIAIEYMYIKILNLYQNPHIKHTISCDSNLQTVDYSATSRLGKKSCSRLKSSCIHRSDHPTSTCYRLCCCPQWLCSRCIRWCQCRANICSSSIIIVSTIGPPAMSRWQRWPNIAAVRATAFSTKSTYRRVASIWLELVSWIFKLLLGFLYGCHLTGHNFVSDNISIYVFMIFIIINAKHSKHTSNLWIMCIWGVCHARSMSCTLGFMMSVVGNHVLLCATRFA